MPPQGAHPCSARSSSASPLHGSLLIEFSPGKEIKGKMLGGHIRNHWTGDRNCQPGPRSKSAATRKRPDTAVPTPRARLSWVRPTTEPPTPLNVPCARVKQHTEPSFDGKTCRGRAAGCRAPQSLTPGAGAGELGQNSLPRARELWVPREMAAGWPVQRRAHSPWCGSVSR